MGHYKLTNNGEYVVTGDKRGKKREYRKLNCTLRNSKPKRSQVALETSGVCPLTTLLTLM